MPPRSGAKASWFGPTRRLLSSDIRLTSPPPPLSRRRGIRSPPRTPSQSRSLVRVSGFCGTASRTPLRPPVAEQPAQQPRPRCLDITSAVKPVVPAPAVEDELARPLPALGVLRPDIPMCQERRPVREVLGQDVRHVLHAEPPLGDPEPLDPDRALLKLQGDGPRRPDPLRTLGVVAPLRWDRVALHPFHPNQFAGAVEGDGCPDAPQELLLAPDRASPPAARHVAAERVALLRGSEVERLVHQPRLAYGGRTPRLTRVCRASNRRFYPKPAAAHVGLNRLLGGRLQSQVVRDNKQTKLSSAGNAPTLGTKSLLVVGSWHLNGSSSRSSSSARQNSGASTANASSNTYTRSPSPRRSPANADSLPSWPAGIR